MAVHKLILEDAFEEDVYTLLAIHCSLEDYRLTYLLNKHLGISLARKSSDIDYNNGKSSHSIFEWEDQKQLTIWNLVSNISKKEVSVEVNYSTLFHSKEKIIKTSHLIPEYKTVDYFLKIDNNFNLSKEPYILKNILKIPQIVTAFSVDAINLKSKNNLIFS